MNVLRKLVFTFLICSLVKIAFSQQRYYIYIQSEDQQEFYVRTGAGIFNSSGNGYLVIPGLEKNTHEIIIGFPGKNNPEWRFNCTISDADLGFVLKAGSNYGMQLLNLGHKEGVNGTVVEHHSQIKNNNIVAASGAISNDPFSSMLAEVVNDPTIRRQLVIVEKKNPAAVAAIDDPPKAVQPGVPAEQKAPDQETKNITSATPPSGTVAKSGSDTAETADQKPAAFAVKEVQKTNSIQSGKSSRAGAAEKAGNTMAAVAEKKYEPFVVREIHEPASTQAAKAPASAAKKEDSAGAALPKEPEPFVLKETVQNDITQTARAKAGTEKTAVNNDEKYLPFVIKPGNDNKNNSEVKAARPEAGEKAIVAETVPPTNDVTLVTKENKATGMEKEKSSKPDSGKKAGSPAKVSTGEKQTPAGKKAVLSSVRKTLERKSREGTDLIYVDENINGAKDTIRIFIPVVQ